MTDIRFKLKQASVVLGVPPKDLQNLVQAGVLKPRKSAGDRYWFDSSLLLRAKIAWYLKESLGVSTKFLATILEGLAKVDLHKERADLIITSRLSPNAAPVEVRVPVARLNSDIEQQLPVARAVPDLPRGRKRATWKREFRQALEEAATDLGSLKRNQILRAVQDYRKKRKNSPEISVALQTQTKVA